MPGLAPVIRVLAFFSGKRSAREYGLGRLPRLCHVLPIALAAIALPAPAFAQSAQLSNLSDVAFGSVITPSGDLSQSQTVCAFAANGLSNRYSITGTGSGGGGAFTLSNGAATLAYEVQWNSAAGQTSGTMLTAGTALTGQTSGGVTAGCLIGLLQSGSLTIVLRSAALNSASAGNFTGTLSLMISPN